MVNGLQSMKISQQPVKTICFHLACEYFDETGSMYENVGYVLSLIGQRPEKIHVGRCEWN